MDAKEIREYVEGLLIMEEYIRLKNELEASRFKTYTTRTDGTGIFIDPCNPYIRDASKDLMVNPYISTDRVDIYPEIEWGKGDWKQHIK